MLPMWIPLTSLTGAMIVCMNEVSESNKVRVSRISKSKKHVKVQIQSD